MLLGQSADYPWVERFRSGTSRSPDRAATSIGTRLSPTGRIRSLSTLPGRSAINAPTFRRMSGRDGLQWLGPELQLLAGGARDD